MKQIFICLLPVLGFSCTSSLEFTARRKEVVGQITYVYSGIDRNGSSDYTYKLNDITRTGFDHRHSCLNEGEKYIVSIHDSTSSVLSSYLKLENPLFLHNEYITPVRCTIIEANKRWIGYDYSINGKRYSKRLYAPGISEGFQPGQSFICLTDINNVSRSVLVADEPLPINSDMQTGFSLNDTILFSDWLSRMIVTPVDSADFKEYAESAIYYYEPLADKELANLKSLTGGSFSYVMDQRKVMLKNYLEIARELNLKTIKLSSRYVRFKNKEGKLYYVDLGLLGNPWKIIFFDGKKIPETRNQYTEATNYWIKQYFND